ncbi:hypothetical protein BH11PLA2_BH11PLA2_13980 [soil metagenome]
MAAPKDPAPGDFDHTRVQTSSPKFDPHLTISHAAALSGPSAPSSPTSGYTGNLHSLQNLLKACQQGDVPPIVDGYKLLEEVGFGGFGAVWQAQDLKTDEIVAIKFLVNENRDTTSVLDEVRHLTSVQGCFGVVPIKIVREQGIAPHYVPYYVMQFAPNGSVHSLIKSRGTLDATAMMKLILPVTKALGYIHDRQVVHSDLKPANILLNDANEPLIADFGQAQRNRHSSGQGTLFYMAPERATTEKLRPDPRWDVYSMGAVMFEMLTGKPPRLNPGLKDKLSQPLRYEERLRSYREGLFAAPRPVLTRHQCDSDLARIIDRCLSLDPGSRYMNADEIHKALLHRNHLRRIKPLIRLGTAACILLLLLALGGSYLFGQRMIEQKKDDVAFNIEDSLRQKVYLGTQIVSNDLSDRISFVEHYANSPRKCTHETRARLAKIGTAIQKGLENGFATPQQLVDPRDLEQMDNWLQNDCFANLARQSPEAVKSCSILAVIPSKEPNTFHGYFVSRIGGDGREGDEPSTTPAMDRTNVTLGNPELYKRDWSFRDYFNGSGNKFDHAEASKNPMAALAHPVITHTHVSRTYRSMARMSIKQKAASYRWRIDIATPIWSEPDYSPGKLKPGSGAILGLLLCGYDLDEDIRDKFETPNAEIQAEANHGYTVPVNYVLLNENNLWVLHNDKVRATIIDERERQTRDPAPFGVPAPLDAAAPMTLSRRVTLASTLSQSMKSGREKFELYQTPHYIDLFQDPIDAPESCEYIASFSRFKPFEYSCYNELRSTAWTFVAQARREDALAPVAEIGRDVFRAASLVLLVLILLAVVLWIWLIRLLKRQEFAVHG